MEIEREDGQPAAANTTSFSRRRLVAFSLLTACIILARWNAESFMVGSKETSTTTSQKNSLAEKGDEISEIPRPVVRPELCVDPDESGPAPTICRCTDPRTPIPGNHIEQWMAYHGRLVQEASRPRDNLDLVLLGDSLIEMWNGTTIMGRMPSAKKRLLFDSLFTKAGGGTLDAIALGTAADRSTNLLWHLQNGMLPDTLHPKVWLILIGTNDLGFAQCSKQTTLQGILHVTEYLHQHRPNAKILLHGLLPRGEGRGRMSLGENWKHIQWINQQLRQTCNTYSSWCYYMDTGTMFLDNAEGAQLNSRTISDGTHPRLSGMRQWGPLMVENVHKILSLRE